MKNNKEKIIVSALMKCSKTINVEVASEIELLTLLSDLRYNHPILFHLGEVEYVFRPRLKEAVLKPCYLYSKTEYEMLVTQLAATVQKIRDQISVAPTMLDRELSIHDALCTKVTYADDGDKSHSIVGPLLYHRGVCDGISKTAKVLLQECGIKSHVIFGNAIATNGNYEPHAWNVVYLNDCWYHLDVTYDNTLSNNNIRYDYFNVSDEMLKRDHVVGNDSKYVNITCKKSMDYYELTNRTFCDLDSLRLYIGFSVNNKCDNIQARLICATTTKELELLFISELSRNRINASFVMKYNEYSGVCCWEITYKKHM